jgi:glyoxylase-like metal-dependent hydrolase (beta-lactamase superfamily II)
MEKILEDVYVLKGHDYCSNVYILDDGNVKIAIDSGNGEIDIGKIGVDYCFLTHGHSDHTRGAIGLNAYLMKEDFLSVFPYFVPKDVKPLEMKELTLSSFKLEFVHTPGHTRGSICIFEKNREILFTGDTLFSDGWVGRTDLPGGNYKFLEESLRKLFKLFGKEKEIHISFPLELDFDISLMCPGHYEIRYFK